MSVLVVGVIVIVMLILQGIGLWFIFGRRRDDLKPEDGTGMVLLQKQVQDLAQTLDRRVSESSKQMQDEAHRRHTES